jgi:hypothetical protein
LNASIFIIGVFAVAIVVFAVRAISNEDREARKNN